MLDIVFVELVDALSVFPCEEGEVQIVVNSGKQLCPAWSVGGFDFEDHVVGDVNGADFG